MKERTSLPKIVKKKLEAWFFTGLLVVGPIGLTVGLVHWLITTMDSLLKKVLPQVLQPDQVFGIPLPGLGLVATVLLILLVGVLATNVIGKAVVAASERLVIRIPLVKGIYSLFKQVAGTVLAADRENFRKVVLIEYPRKDIWSVGFVTGVAKGELQAVTGKKVINVFMPTTPNPTSGYYLLVPEEDAVVLSMTVEEAFKLIVSGGMVMPPDRRPSASGGEIG